MELVARLGKLKHEDKIAINDYGIIKQVTKRVHSEFKPIMRSAILILLLGVLRFGVFSAWLQIGYGIAGIITIYSLKQKIQAPALLSMASLLALAIVWNFILMISNLFNLMALIVLLLTVMQVIWLNSYFRMYRQWSRLTYETVTDEIRLWHEDLYQALQDDFNNAPQSILKIHGSTSQQRLYLSHTGSLISIPKEERVWFDLEQTLVIKETKGSSEFTVHVTLSIQDYRWSGWMERRDFERYQAWSKHSPKDE